MWPMPNGPVEYLPNPARYQRMVEGVVRDKVTGMEWKLPIASENGVEETPSHGWEGAKTHCESVAFDGGGWRLPTRIELTSIVDTTRTDPAYDVEYFPYLSKSVYWTASVVAWSTEENAWSVELTYGISRPENKRDQHQVICCR